MLKPQAAAQKHPAASLRERKKLQQEVSTVRSCTVTSCTHRLILCIAPSLWACQELSAAPWYHISKSRAPALLAEGADLTSSLLPACFWRSHL